MSDDELKSFRLAADYVKTSTDEIITMIKEEIDFN